jgi:hypothetical protein
MFRVTEVTFEATHKGKRELGITGDHPETSKQLRAKADNQVK